MTVGKRMTGVGPFFKWYGSKWQSSRHYPAPLHARVIEPFAGSAGYACRHFGSNVVLFDTDPHVMALWAWLVGEATDRAVRDIPVGLPAGTDIRSLGLGRGQELLLKHWQRTNNVGDCWTVSSWGHLPGQWTESTRARVADEIGAIKHWQVAKDPYRYIDEPSTWFLDPPYQFNYKYRKDSPKLDYTQFDSLLQTISAESLVIVCEAMGKNGETPNYLPFVSSHVSVTSRRKSFQSHHSKELIYVQWPRSRLPDLRVAVGVPAPLAAGDGGV